MGVQAFGVGHTNLEGVYACGAFQGQIQTACGVLAEHQILTICQSEGLFVGAFYGRLNGCVERGLVPFVNFNRIHVVPPLTISPADLRAGLDILDEVLGARA